MWWMLNQWECLDVKTNFLFYEELKSENLCEQCYKEEYVISFENKSLSVSKNELDQIWMHIQENFVSSERKVKGHQKFGN